MHNGEIILCLVVQLSQQYKVSGSVTKLIKFLEDFDVNFYDVEYS